MKKAGKMWIRDDDDFMADVFKGTGDKFNTDHLESAMKYVTDASLAIDGGAQYGSWTRYMAARFKRVYAFEPVEMTYECLEKNAGYLNNVDPVKAALGRTITYVKVGPGKKYDHPGMETVLAEDGEVGQEGVSPMIDLDFLNLRGLGLLKLDLEGYELHALEGAEKTLKKCKPVVIFEDNGRCYLEHGVPEGACGKFLESLGAKELQVCNKDFIYGWT